MTSAATSLFSRDSMLKRQARISRGRSCNAKPTQPCPSSSAESEPLNIIFEEDESRSSSPSSCYSVLSSPEGSPILGVKARRRHATVSVSDIRLSRVLPVEDFNHDHLSSPRPAPRPPITSTPPGSPDSFRLTFTDVSFKFPHPPIPTPTSLRSCRYAEYDSPTHSSSSLSSSPGSQTEAMPLTPSTSDDDEFGPSLMSRRPVIQPLVITKHNPRPFSLFDDDCAISPTLLQPFKTPLENLTGSAAPLSPLSPTYLPEEFWYEPDEASDSEPESDSEWYTKEFSKIISLRSPIPPSFPLHTPARPDSMSISSVETLPSKRRRVSKPLPPTPLSGGFPSAQLDPAFSRRSKRRTIPNYPPPPIPTTPSSLASSTSSRRPPPRSSIPADCVYDLADVEDAGDTPSTFSFSIYDVYLGDRPDEPETPASSYSQEDPIDGVTFDLDYPMMLPLSLPASPFDLEADIAQGLEQLRNSPVDVQPTVWPTINIVEPEQQPGEVHEEQQQPQPQQQPQQQQQVINDVFSPFSPTFPAHSPTSPHINEEKVLKSKWSSSTLGSIREEHERTGASAKLRLYFGHSPLKNAHKQRSKKASLNSPSPVPALSLSPRSRKTPAVVPPSPAASAASASPGARSPGKPTRATRGYSDVLVIGYGNNGHGMRRRGSVTNSVSDAGSEESTSSTSSSGLRRKPIPVEMFLRSAV